ncbi:hypothetical protein GQ602_006815 [Ophiocordyceps camponoti-floridani]|uniref:Uncharacterized protein n=1 Tax=Ophiocordyceps camponoti-floridani TaxID=2030778 RepID=A0A8H4Q236_9HYPO|nr:hypothetical protein GQ602_006815 [Ophiocordyceps camponoti-floridani]
MPASEQATHTTPASAEVPTTAAEAPAAAKTGKWKRGPQSDKPRTQRPSPPHALGIEPPLTEDEQEIVDVLGPTWDKFMLHRGLMPFVEEDVKLALETLEFFSEPTVLASVGADRGLAAREI